MTVQVAICDDEKQICADLESMLKKAFSKYNVKHEIDVYYAGEKLYNKMEAGAQYDLIFLDIEFAKFEISGIEAGKRIRETLEQQTVSIVYISWEKEYSMQLHKIRPLDFLMKPLNHEKIEEVLQTHLKLSRIAADEFIYKTRNETRRVKIKDIVYVESTNRQLTLHLSDGTKKTFYGTLKDAFIEQLQKADFLQIHASYAVNYSYVQALTRSQVMLTTGVTLPISRHKKDEVEEAYFAITERQGVV